MKKIFFLAFFLVFAGLLWAGGSGAATTTMADEPVTIQVIQRLAPQEMGPWEGSWLKELILEKFNVHYEIDSLGNEPYVERERVALMSGDMPDIMGPIAISLEEVKQFGENGVLYAVDTVFDKLPDYAARLKKYTVDAARLTAADGHIYTLAGGYPEPLYSNGSFVRKDFLDNVGFDYNKVMPGTFDDHLDMYRALLKANDGKPVLANRKGIGGLLERTMKPLGLTQNTRYFIDAEDRFDYPFTHPDGKVAVQFLRTMYEEGIMEPDILTMTEDEFEPVQEASYKWPAVWDNTHWCYTFPPRYLAEHPDSPMHWVPVLPPTWKGEIQGWRTGFAVNPINIVSAKTKNIDAICKVVNWFYSTDGSAASWYGRENEDFVWVGDLPVPLFEGPAYNYKFPEGFNLPRPLKGQAEQDEYSEKYRIYLKSMAYLTIPMALFLKTNTMDPAENMLVNEYIPMYGKVYKSSPEPFFNMGDYADDLLSMVNQLNTAAEEAISKMVVGLSPMSTWDDLQKTLKAFGVDDYVALLNKAYKEGR